MAREERPGRRHSFPVHGGACRIAVREGVVRIDQSPWRHMHTFAWLVSAGTLLAGLYSLATGWQYTGKTGMLVGWPTLLALGGIMPLFALGRIVVLRLRGFTGADRIPVSAIESVAMTTREIRWYFKTRRDVPTLLIDYRIDGDRGRRLVMFRPRFDDVDVRRAARIFESAGVDVEVSDEVRSMLG